MRASLDVNSPHARSGVVELFQHIASFSHNNKNAMAAGLSVRSVMMRDAHFIPESNGDICDTASQGSKDEVIEYPSDFVEDRFRVDRKKLEQMLQGKVPYPDELSNTG